MLCKENTREKCTKSITQMKILFSCIPDEEQSMCHFQTVRVANTNSVTCIEIKL